MLYIKTWYQVYTPTYIFGFCAQNGRVVDAPDWRWKGKSLEDIKPWLRVNATQVVKIADVQY